MKVIILLLLIYSLCVIAMKPIALEISDTILTPPAKSTKSTVTSGQCPQKYKLTSKNIADLGVILQERAADKPSGIDGKYDLLDAAVTKGIGGPLKLLAEDILNCFGESSGCKEGCDSFSHRLYGSDFEPNDNVNNMKKLKFLTFWSGTSFAKKQSEKLANHTNSQFIDMCAGTVGGLLLTGLNKNNGAGEKLNRWFKALKNDEEIDVGAGNQNLWTPMSKVLADKWFRPGINAVGLLDYYRKTSGNYFHNDEMPLLTKKQTTKNRLVIMIHKSCSIIKNAITKVFGENINVDTNELSVLNLKNGCPHRHCIGGYKSSNFNDAANAPAGSDKRKVYDSLDKKFKDAFKGYDDYYKSMWKKNNWLIFAFKEKEILCSVAEIREFVLNRRDKGLTHDKLSNILVGEWASNDDERLKSSLSRLVRIQKARKVAGSRRAPAKKNQSKTTNVTNKKSANKKVKKILKP